MRNIVPNGFLEAYRNGRDTRFLTLAKGFLKLEYSDGLLCLVSFVAERSGDASAIGRRLELSLSGDPVVTFITVNGVSGHQWAHGEVFWGHTYEDDGPPAEGRKIPLGDWVDECVAAMVDNK